MEKYVTQGEEDCWAKVFPRDKGLGEKRAVGFRLLEAKGRKAAGREEASRQQGPGEQGA